MSLKEEARKTNMQSYSFDGEDVMSDMRYVCQSCSLITGALQRGCDVLQLPNGDIVVTELKPITFQYTWDNKKGKLIRTQSGLKLRKTRSNNNSSSSEEDNFSSVEQEQELETV
jgi:hypothetical protein